MSESPNPTAQQPGSNDPLSSLYRMSKTAGLATSDYQAVNVPSVVALLLGLASYLATFDSILLIIPLAGLIVGLIAFIQIQRSNGTQTGAFMAIAGIALSLASGGWAGSARYREASRTAADRAALVKLVDDLWLNVSSNKIDAAYALFTDNFRKNVSKAQFELPWNSLKGPYALKKLSSNGLFAFEEDAVTQVRVASGQIVVEFENTSLQTDRPQILFTHRNGSWAIENIPSYFMPQQLRDTTGGRAN